MTFEPRNNLEKSLIGAQEGTISGEQFIQALLESQVYMPIFEKSGNEIANIQLSAKAKPLALTNEDGDEYLILFTSPERAPEFVQDHPGYESGGLLTEFLWILEKMGVGFGISLNPDQKVGLDLEPQAIQEIAAGRKPI